MEAALLLFGQPTNQQWLAAALTIIGLVIASRCILRVLGFVWVYFLRPGKSLSKYGAWTVVTGASDGIGKAMCFEFAKRGQNVLLVSRTQSKLDDVARQIKAKYPQVSVDTIAIDLCSAKDEDFERVEQKLADLDVGVFVNNAGMSYDHAKFFLELDESMADNIMSINVYSLMRLTHLVLPMMLKKKRGAIVNVSSGSGSLIDPLYAVYSASKAFVVNFSEALHYEYKSSGIDVQASIPLLVSTKMSKIRKSSLFIPTPAAYAAATVRQIGYGTKLFPYWSHALQWSLISVLPQWIVTKVLYNKNVSIRKRALKKKKSQ